MRAVLDTNVLVSGLYFGGLPGQIISAWRAAAFQTAVTALIVTEYRRVASDLARHRRLEPAVDLIDLLVTRSIFIDDPAGLAPLCRDPDDDKFLACAASTNSTLVSGDKDLLAVDGVLGVRVLTPRAFLDALSRGHP